MNKLCIILSLLAAHTSASAQTVGGEFQTLYQWDGNSVLDFFGMSMAAAGDVNADGIDDVIVGAPYANPGGVTNTGAAYVYSGLDGTLLYEWTGGTSSDYFGSAVSTAGDINADGFDDLLIGAPGTAFGGLFQTGSAYIYSGADGTLLQQWDSQIDRGSFGSSVSGVGDIDLDGFPDVLIASPGSSFYTKLGSVNIYSGATGALIFEWQGQHANDNFANSASGAGDVNQDGYPDVIVGAPWATRGGMTNAGAAYVYSGLDGALLYEWVGQTPSDLFACSVDGAGDVNQDGFADLIVGSFEADPGGLEGAGSAFVYSGKNGNLLFRLDGQLEGDQFGISVSGAGDVNKDSCTDFLVGATMADPGGRRDAGSAFLFSGKDGSQLKRWDGVSEDDLFGESVSAAGDLNADGYADVLVAAPRASMSTGRANAFVFNPLLLANTSTISASAGGTLQLEIDFPANAAFFEYKVLLSASGVGPSLVGVLIPLTWDTLFIDAFFGIYPVSSHSNLNGILDLNGDASAGMLIPAGIPSSLIGRTYYLAAVANGTGPFPEISSVSVPVLIVP